MHTEENMTSKINEIWHRCKKEKRNKVSFLIIYRLTHIIHVLASDNRTYYYVPMIINISAEPNVQGCLFNDGVLLCLT